MFSYFQYLFLFIAVVKVKIHNAYVLGDPNDPPIITLSWVDQMRFSQKDTLVSIIEHSYRNNTRIILLVYELMILFYGSLTLIVIFSLWEFKATAFSLGLCSGSLILHAVCFPVLILSNGKCLIYKISSYHHHPGTVNPQVNIQACPRAVCISDIRLEYVVFSTE